MTHRREPSRRIRLPVDYYCFSDTFGHIDAHGRFISLGGGYRGLLRRPPLYRRFSYTFCDFKLFGLGTSVIWATNVTAYFTVCKLVLQMSTFKTEIVEKKIVRYISHIGLRNACCTHAQREWTKNPKTRFREKLLRSGFRCEKE